MAKASKAQLEANARYKEKHHGELFSVKVEFHKERDSDLLEKLSKVPSKQGYIKGLIRTDIEQGE